MPPVKRSRSAADGFIQYTPNKAAKKDVMIKELEAKLVELHQFIIAEHMLMKAPPLIRQQIQNHPGAAKRFDAAIRAWIVAAHEKCKEAKYSDESSSAMANFVPEIEQLSEMQDGLELSFSLVLFLGEHSFLRDDRERYHKHRSSDELADMLLMKLAKKRMKKDPKFLPTQEVAQLQEQIQYLKEKKGVETYFSDSFDLMWSWVQGPQAVQKFHDTVKAEISATYAQIIFEKRNKQENYESVDDRMGGFVPRIRSLSLMSGNGLQLAFDLVLYLGRHTYLEEPYRFRDPSRKHLDEAMDELLWQVATAIKEEQPEFRPQQAVDTLRTEIEFLAETKLETYFPKSFKLLCSWFPDSSKAYAEEIQKEVQARVWKAHKILERRLKVYVRDQKSPMSDWLGDKMIEFLDDVKTLSQMMQGVLPAIDLLIYLGECSYPKREICKPLYGWSLEEYSEQRGEFEREADSLLEKLVEMARKEDENFRPFRQVARLKESIDYLAGFMIRSYFPDSYRLMSGLV